MLKCGTQIHDVKTMDNKYQDEPDPYCKCALQGCGKSGSPHIRPYTAIMNKKPTGLQEAGILSTIIPMLRCTKAEVC